MSVPDWYAQFIIDDTRRRMENNVRKNLPKKPIPPLGELLIEGKRPIDRNVKEEKIARSLLGRVMLVGSMVLIILLAVAIIWGIML